MLFGDQNQSRDDGDYIADYLNKAYGYTLHETSQNIARKSRDLIKYIDKFQIIKEQKGPKLPIGQ